MIEENKLSEQEKVVRKYYEVFVQDGSEISNKEAKKLMREFCEEFSKASLYGTRYQDSKINIDKTYKKNRNGSMSMRGSKADRGNMKINYNRFLKKYGMNSTSEYTRFKGFCKLLETTNHEIRHFFQNRDNSMYDGYTPNITIADASDYTKEDIARRIDEDFYDSKKGNYRVTMKEGDARRVGCLNMCNQLLRAVPKLNDEQISYLASNIERSIKNDNIEYRKLVQPRTNIEKSRNDITRKYTDYLMAYNPKETIKKFPILEYEYKKDGSRKETYTMWNEYNCIKSSILRSKLSENAQKEMLEDLSIGYSKNILNSFKEMDDFEREDLVHRLGKDEVKKIIDFTIDGLESEFDKREKNFKLYYETVKNNSIEKYVDKYKLDSALSQYRSLAGYGSKWNPFKQENYIGFSNQDTKFLNQQISDIYVLDDYIYTPEEKRMADKEIKKRQNKRLEYNKQKYDMEIKKHQGRGIFRIFKKVSKLALSEASIEEINEEYNVQEEQLENTAVITTTTEEEKIEYAKKVLKGESKGDNKSQEPQIHQK